MDTVIFATYPFVAYDHFVDRRLNSNESKDAYLAELLRLSTLYGGVSNRRLACAFVSVLPKHVRKLLRASFRMDALDVKQSLERASHTER